MKKLSFRFRFIFPSFLILYIAVSIILIVIALVSGNRLFSVPFYLNLPPQNVPYGFFMLLMLFMPGVMFLDFILKYVFDLSFGNIETRGVYAILGTVIIFITYFILLYFMGLILDKRRYIFKRFKL